MARLKFSDIKISAIVTTIGDKEVKIEEEAKNFWYDEKNIKKVKKDNRI